MFLEELKAENYINMVVAQAIPKALTVKEVEAATANDKLLQTLKQWLTTDTKRPFPVGLERFKHVRDDLSCTKGGIVLRGNRIVIPASLQTRVVDLAHGGHQGIVKTKALIRSRVWFAGIDAKVEHAVKVCAQCQVNTDKESYEPMRPSPMPPAPWHTISGDYFGPLDDGWYWHVTHDEYSRWFAVDRVKSTSMDDLEPALERLFSTFGAPVIFKSDNGSPYQSYRFSAFADKWGFRHRKITPLWPRANAGVESVMKKLGKVLKTAESANIDKNKHLQEFLKRYRETPHSTTKVPPALLLMGFTRTSGLPQIETPWSCKELGKWHKIAQENDRISKQNMKLEYDNRMRVKECGIVVGCKVLIRLKTHKKSTPKWDGKPYVVTEVNGSMVTAARHNHVTTRNSSFFKRFRFAISEANKNEPESGESLVETPQTAIETPQTAIETPQTNIENPQTASETPQVPIENFREGEVDVGRETITPTKSNPYVQAPVRVPGKIVRPTLEQIKINEAKNAQAKLEKKATNPPVRESARLAAKQASKSNGGVDVM